MTGHDYLSTACLHERHDQCRRSCKFCGMPCRCECHQDLNIGTEPDERSPLLASNPQGTDE